MKKLILTAAVFSFLFAAHAQSVKTERYANGNKKSEGVIIGDANVSPGTSKEAQARQLESVVKDGAWTTWFENGQKRSEEMYAKGTMIGAWKYFYEDGKTESEIDFSKGTAVYYFKNGSKQSEGGIANGMISVGKWTGYHENGQKNYEGSYNAQGQKDGVWAWWDKDGKFLAEQTFKNGELISKK